MVLARASGRQECASCSTSSSDLRPCTGCYVVWYCNETCQAAHWRSHQAKCLAHSSTPPPPPPQPKAKRPRKKSSKRKIPDSPDPPASSSSVIDKGRQVLVHRATTSAVVAGVVALCSSSTSSPSPPPSPRFEVSEPRTPPTPPKTPEHGDSPGVATTQWRAVWCAAHARYLYLSPDGSVGWVLPSGAEVEAAYDASLLPPVSLLPPIPQLSVEAESQPDELGATFSGLLAEAISCTVGVAHEAAVPMGERKEVGSTVVMSPGGFAPLEGIEDGSRTHSRVGSDEAARVFVEHGESVDEVDTNAQTWGDEAGTMDFTLMSRAPVQEVVAVAGGSALPTTLPAVLLAAVSVEKEEVVAAVACEVEVEVNAHEKFKRDVQVWGQKTK